MAPLAELLRPTSLDDFVGQEDIIGDKGIVNILLDRTLNNKDNDQTNFPSFILWGPPGCGKTTLARIIAKKLNREFYEFSAVSTSIKDIEKVMKNDMLQPPIIFIDEIHRFNKAQQDKLLPFVERGTVTLIGATTENPSFEVISPLLSRCRVLVLKMLEENELQTLIRKAEKYLSTKLDKKSKKFLIEASNGDARVLLNVIDIANSLKTSKTLKIDDIENALQRRQLNFDDKGEEYYNTISAFIKSMRASNTDAALYYLARMVAAGQDPLYIARRMVVFASEDIGMANPNALLMANEVFRACETIGYPECQENLAHGVVYLCQAKKDRSAYDAYMKALSDVRQYGNLPIPKNILNAPTKLMKQLGYGKNYDKYTTDSLLPEKIKNKKYYQE